MTGFGRGSAPLGQGRVLVELRTLNHRFQDLRLHLPTELGELEEEIDRRLRNLFKRGRIEVTVRLAGSTGQTLRLDRPLARRILAELQSLSDEMGLHDAVTVNILASVPQVFVQDVSLDIQGALQALLEALGQAIEAADDMRRREGTALARDFDQRLLTVTKIVRHLEVVCRDVAPAALERLRERVRMLIDQEERLDENRLVHEIALLADRTDIEEELTRLASHVEQFRQIASEKGAVGRRLDFLLQEMAREASTVGAKVQDAEIQHIIVDLRGEIARMREQIQNVE